jgi:hypothetical protein
MSRFEFLTSMEDHTERFALAAKIVSAEAQDNEPESLSIIFLIYYVFDNF